MDMEGGRWPKQSTHMQVNVKTIKYNKRIQKLINEWTHKVGFFTIKSKNIMPGNSSFWMYSLKHY
jgi:hypothetical protein